MSDDLVARLRACLKKCSDDLAAYIEDHYAIAAYSETLDYPSQKRRYDRDMAPVIEARKLLDEETVS